MSVIKNIKEIKITDGRRTLNTEAVEKLAKSILEVGLINPITISSDNILIAGQHRLEALKSLSVEEVECRVVDFKFNDDLSVIVEFAENEERTELTRADKLKIYDAVRKARDFRKGNGGHDTRKIKVGEKSPTLISTKKQQQMQHDERRKSDAIEVGFSSRDEMQRTSTVLNNCIPEVMEAVENGKISLNKAWKIIARLPKEEQLQALNEDPKKIIKKVENIEKEERNIISKKVALHKKSDKHGAYTEIKIYPHDAKKTVDNICSVYSVNFKDRYDLLIAELMRQRRSFSDLSYKTFSYGIKTSDGEVLEIKALIKEGKQQRDIAVMFDVSEGTIQRINKMEV